MTRTFVLAAAASLAFAAAFAGPAEARGRAFTAQLAQPVAERIEVVAQGAVWRCEGDVCRATVQEAATVSGCRMLVRRVGAVSAYGAETRPMSEDRLARCNAVAATPAETASAED